MDEFLGREVYIVTGSEDEETSEIFITESQLVLDERLISMSPMIDQETRVIHGVLTPAETLPPSFRGKTVFMMALDPGSGTISEGCVIESNCTTPEELAAEIETIIDAGVGFSFGSSEVKIGDLYIIYGYELKVGLAINEADIDEETIDACINIADEIEDVSIMYTAMSQEEDF
jgi:hypothetical protein